MFLILSYPREGVIMDNNEKQAEISQDVLIATGIALILGLGLGYFAYPVFSSGQTAVAGNDTTACAMGGFEMDAAKVNDIKALWEDMLFLQSGSKHSVKYVNYTEKNGLIALDFVIDDVYPQKLYITKDYEYLLQQPVKFSDIKGQVAMAKAQAEEALKPPEKSDKPKVQLFVMSYCPYGNLAEKALKDVVDLLSDKVDFEPVYIISGSNGNYNSLHGQKELEQDVREKIIFNKYGAKKWMEYVYDADTNCTLNNIDTCWKEVATRAGVDATAVEAEYAANFNAIADGEVAKTSQNGVSASPTLLVNSKKYSGDFIPEAYKDWICSGFNTMPQECDTQLSTTSALSGKTGTCG